MKPYLPLTVAVGLLGLAGCVAPNDGNPPPPDVVYAEPPPPPPAGAGPVSGPSETVYVPPGTYASAPSYSQDDYDADSGPVPSEGEVEVDSVSDFDEPLAPYGDWVVVSNYGRCWRPRRVAGDWRPYCEGHWEDTDRGWYWQSDEPWGWATYHYGRWDYAAGYGWIWVPHTRWAPAWVEWRSGAGYVGWAPLPPGARFDRGHEIRGGHAQDRNYVFVQSRHFGDHVRPSTVVVNNTTIIHQTTNITNITIVNNRVRDGGPPREQIEKESGHTFRPVPAVQLRRQIEKPVAAQHPVLTHPHGDRANPNNSSNNPNQPVHSAGPREPFGNPAENHQPGAAPQNRASDRVENRPQNHDANLVRHPNDGAPVPTPVPQAHPTPLPHPSGQAQPVQHPAVAPVHPTAPPAHLNQQMHQLNAQPTLAPLHHENTSTTLRPSPTMKPIENHNNASVVHPVAPTHVPAPTRHVETIPAPHTIVNAPAEPAPQQRQHVQTQSPVFVPPHSNESSSNGGRISTPPAEVHHAPAGPVEHHAVAPAEHHDAAPNHSAPVVHAKPPPPAPPTPKTQDNTSKDQPQK